MPQLGLGLGLHKNSLGLTPLQLLLKYTSAMWLPSKASGQPFPTLEPRTLPNGVSNVGWTQNVSVDVAITSGMVAAVLDRATITHARIPISQFVPSPVVFVDAVQGIFSIPSRTEVAYSETMSVGTFATRADQFLYFAFPLGTTLAQARTLLAGTVIRYQLATPIDTLNSPFTNPLIDLKGNAPLTLQGFAGTQSSGYAPVVCKNIGQEGSYTNLVTNGDFSQGTTGWFGNPNNLVITSGVAEVTGTGQTISITLQTTAPLTPAIVIGKRYYVASKLAIKVGTPMTFRLYLGGVLSILADATQPNVLKKRSTIITAISTDSTPFSYTNFSDAVTQNGKVLQSDEFQIINLTDNPLVQSLESQLGRQLTVEECDYLFTFTASTSTVKAKTVPFLKFDGANDLGIANHPSLDITGTGDLAIEVVFKTDASLVNGYVVFRGLDSANNSQYAMFFSADAGIRLFLNGVEIQITNISTLQINTLYTLLVYRFNGALKSRLTKIETYNQLNNTNIVTRPHFRVGARTASADGLTHSTFTNIFLGHLAITNGQLTPFTEAELISKFDSYTLKTFGI